MNDETDFYKPQNSGDIELIPPMEVPPGAISEDALLGLIGEFILRDGTDYGLIEISHATKVEQIRRQLTQGQIKIVFDPNTESVTLLTDKEWKKAQRS